MAKTQSFKFEIEKFNGSNNLLVQGQEEGYVDTARSGEGTSRENQETL